MKTFYKKAFLSFIGMTIAFAFVACSSDDESVAQETSIPVQSSSPTSSMANTESTTNTVSVLTGIVEVDGSSTVAPVSEAVAEEFKKLHPKANVLVGVSGSGGGFKRFVIGETDISNASRGIKSSEAEKAKANGIDFAELRIGMDGLSVMVNPSNTFVDCLTTTELKKIWEPGSSVNNWNQVRSSFPNQKMRLYGPGTDSGTFDFFTDEINGEGGASRDDYTMSEDDNVIVQGIAGDQYSLGYFGYAYYAANKDKLKVIGIDSGEGCVVPSAETIDNASYKPLTRPLYIYVKKSSYANKQVVKEFVDFYMKEAGALTAEVGYVPVKEEEYKANLDKVIAKTESMTNTVSVLTGMVEVDGSSTVAPVSEAVAEEFKKLHPKANVLVGVSGSGGGFKRFVIGETDISNASRGIKSSEAEKAKANGIDFAELRIGMDGLSVMVNPSNTFVDCLTTTELKKIWEPGSSVNNWNQVRSSFPNQKMRLYGPGTDSGTFDFFTDEINGEGGASRDDYTMSEDDNVIVQGIAGDQYSLGYFGYAYYAANKDKLKVIGIDSGEGCVVPSAETIDNASYKPLTRPLYIYVKKSSYANKQVVKEFVDFYMKEAGALTAEVGYVPVKEEEYKANLDKVK